jgi:hypothetical protein
MSLPFSVLNLFAKHKSIVFVILLSTQIFLANQIYIPVAVAQPPSVCPTPNFVQHWDKIVFKILDQGLAKRHNLTANTELDIKVQDDPHSVADVKQKVLQFLNESNEFRNAIQIQDVQYALICAIPSRPG